MSESDLTPPHGIVRPRRRLVLTWGWTALCVTLGGIHAWFGEWYGALLWVGLAGCMVGEVAAQRLIEVQREQIALLQAEVEQAYFRPGWRP